MKYLNAVQWGLLHNAPALVLLVAAVWCWAQEKRGLSVACALGGAIARPLLVRFTEPMISGYREPLGLTVVNIISMSLLQVLLVAYLGTEANWSNWRIDLGLGSLAGISLTIGQGVVSQGIPALSALLTSAAMAAAGALALVGIRKLKRRTLFLALMSAALLAVVMTFVMNAVNILHWIRG